MGFQLLLGLAGIAGILFGARIAIDGSKAAAKKLGISEFFIGLTILSIGTSLPEIFTHIASSIRILQEPENVLMLSGIAVGTNIGSNIIQITLITGLAGLVATIHTTKRFMRRDYVFMLFGIFLLWLFCLGSVITRAESIILFVLYILYLWKLGSTEHLVEKISNHNNKHYGWDVFKIAIGVIALILCAQLVIDSAAFFSDYFNIAGSLIGALIIGIATALPEFTTAVTALLKKSSGLSLGTLVGSNITNPLFALGIGGTISTYQVDNDIIWYYLPFWFFISVIGFFLFLRGYKLYRWEALLLIFSYPVFIAARLFLEVAG
jgi:cation:H+ antiporter